MKDFIIITSSQLTRLRKYVVFSAHALERDGYGVDRCLAVGRGSRGLASIAPFFPSQFGYVHIYPCESLLQSKTLERELIKSLRPAQYSRRRSFSPVLNPPVESISTDPVPVEHGRKPKHLIKQSKSSWSPRSRGRE